jgi:aryl carrier-like protein
LSRGQIGEIVIQGENVIKNYEDNPEANKTAFTGGWFRTGDQGYLDEDHYLFITGRLKEIINRGGEKISPREIDDILLEHPAVSQAVAFAAPDSQLGEDIAAAVVLKDNAALNERELQDFAAAHIADFKIPRKILFVKEIPKGPTGKPQRIGLAKALGVSFDSKTKPGFDTAFQAPRTETERLLVEIWSEVLGRSQFGVFHTFIELGGDSVLAAKIVSSLRDSLQIEVTLRDFFQSPTIESMAQVVESRLLEELEAEDRN